jgi:penicillin-binding protein 2
LDSKQFRRRVWAVILALSVAFLSMGSALYDLQINQGEEYYEKSQRKIAEIQTVEAARGQILDRNGRVLVSNRAVYQVTLDTSRMGDTQQRNDTLLTLVQVARENGVSWNDTLPISAQPPFVFTTADPYYTTSIDEDGVEQKNLTRLGKLAVTMDWISDPTKDPQPTVSTPTPEPEGGFWNSIKNFFRGEGASSAPTSTSTSANSSAPDQTSLPTAEQLLGKMCASFELQGEGVVDEKSGQEVPALNIGDLDASDARAVAGILYELTLRSKGIYQAASYVFSEDVGIDFISRVKELSLPGVNIQATTVREYHTTYAAHVLGRVAAMSPEEWAYYKTVDLDGDGVVDYQMDDTVGKEGVELAFESYLRGTPGSLALERNTNGKVLSETWITEPEPGNNVVLTLDLDLQMAVEDILASSLPNLESEEVEGAACVVLDVDSGDVLASASYPTFDLANYSRDYNENAADPLRPFLNRALMGLYPPGSTFKMITAIAGLEEKDTDGNPIITPSTIIKDQGVYTYYSSPQPKCWIYRQNGGRTHGNQNVTQAITNSCNYFFYDVGRRLGIETLEKYAAMFGLGQKTGIELSENAGVMAGPEFTESMGGTWYEGSTLSVAIGQESTQVTPIQLANYIATLANGGTRYSTHLLKEVKSSDFSQVLYSYEPQIMDTIEIQEKNLEAVKKGMLDLTTTSLARAFSGLNVSVGAKTGSAQISAQSESNAVFVCFAPYDDPEIAVSIVVEHGGSGSELATMAADILSYYFSSKETREDLPTENILVR